MALTSAESEETSRVGEPLQRATSLPLAMAAPARADVTTLVRGLAPNVRAVYAHVPFCFHKCHYCDFYSFVDAEDRQPAYVERLSREIRAAVPFFTREVETIFVGGGTPTLLRPPLLRAALDVLRKSVPLAPGAEWTVEANPETVTNEVADVLVTGGVNRVSLGAQSFDPRHLKTLERWHDPMSVGRAVAALRAAGIGRINVDLIFGIPGSTLEDWQRDLDSALALGPEHISCYGLTYEPNTAMTKRLERGQFEPCDEDVEAAMYEYTLAALAARGFDQYEISNWAKPGEACRHNLLYWTNADWWALGPSASGHVQGTRFKNIPRITDWLLSDGASPVVDVETPDAERRAGEILMLGLRLNAGLGEAEVEACFETSRGVERRAAIDRHRAGGLLEFTDGRLRFTRHGQLLADEVLADLV
ncbi:MAG: radical SAM family heme chaperone HemW [Phycisphaerae bacterium]|nr:radical SAM family heme chaperone HemW [Phycisphaerae bacterium]